MIMWSESQGMDCHGHPCKPMKYKRLPRHGPIRNYWVKQTVNHFTSSWLARAISMMMDGGDGDGSGKTSRTDQLSISTDNHHYCLVWSHQRKLLSRILNHFLMNWILLVFYYSPRRFITFFISLTTLRFWFSSPEIGTFEIFKERLKVTA